MAGPSLQGAAGAGAVDERLIALMRCLLAVTALLLFLFDTGPRWPLAPEILSVLAGYSLYCGAQCIVLFARRKPLWPPAQHWMDVAVYGVLAILTVNLSSVFFLLFFFPIVVASFSRGFGEGLTVTAVAAGLTAAVALSGASMLPAIDALTQPVQLLVAGTVIAYWAGRERAHHERLELLREVAAVINPRLGVDHAIAGCLRRLRDFFRAGDCILVCPRGPLREYFMYRAQEGSTESRRPPQHLTEESAAALLAFEPHAALAWPRPRTARGAATQEPLGRLANLLETSCFATVPFPLREGPAGRLYLIGGRCPNDEAALHFLRQVVDQIAAAVDNLTLVEQVMQNAAKLERARISRDIHDTTLQPYIGLKLGLEALARKLPPDSAAGRELAELLLMSTQVIGDLRGYVARLRGDDTAWPGEHLVSGLREHVGRYRSFYGIEVDLRSDAAMRVSDRVAGEAYQIVCEALSNIHRHTPAKRAYIDLRCEDEHLAIEVGNEASPGAGTAGFVPRSIAERAAALGGRAEVELDRGGHDVVRVAIPL